MAEDDYLSHQQQLLLLGLGKSEKSALVKISIVKNIKTKNIVF